MRRSLILGLVIGGLGAAGCGALPGVGGSSGSGTATPSGGGSNQSAAPLANPHTEPTDPCSALSAATTQKFKLVRPSKRILPAADADPKTGQVIDYNFVRCSWSFDNPAKGPNGRPNGYDYTVTYVVIKASYPTAEETAKQLYLSRKEKLTTDPKRTVKNTESPSGFGDEAVYVGALEKSSLDEATHTELLIRSKNAYVTISFNGADLRSDPSLPRGQQLVTSAVREDLLKPTVMGTAEEVLKLLN